MQEAIWVVALLVGVLAGIIGERWRNVRADARRKAEAYAKRVRTRRQKRLKKVDEAHSGDHAAPTWSTEQKGFGSDIGSSTRAP